jgi:hypothetical protein
MPYAAQWYANERPSYSFYCPCGLAITGQSEKGLHTLIRKHREKGIFHLEYTGEEMTPVPQGVISTSTGPVDPEVVQEVVQDLDEAIAEADKEEAVEEYLPEQE